MTGSILSTDIESALIIATALGSGLIAGVFLAFSSFVMRALGQMPAPGGIEAMQRINRTVLTPLFLGPFFGTALVGLGLAVDALWQWSQPGAGLLLLGAVLYVAGTFGVTLFFNVPLNERLAEVEPGSEEGAALWAHYLERWTLWNHVRTAAAFGAMACLVAQSASSSG